MKMKPLLSAALVALVCCSCTASTRLNTAWTDEKAIAGPVTLIEYGCTRADDLETIAFLVPDGAGPAFEPYAPDFKFSVKKNVPSAEALDEAKRFARCHTAVDGIQVAAVRDPQGKVLGYEVRPQYMPFAFGGGDVLDVNYFLRDGKVVVYIRLNPSVERMLSNGDSDRDK